MVVHRVLLAEDNTDAARVIAELINDEPDLECTGVVSTPGGILAALETQPVDALLLDLELGHESGITVLAECRRRFPEVAIFVLSGHANPALMTEARARGAHDYLVKPEDLEVLVTRLRSIIKDHAE
ncbi:MAG: response regulator [Gammaproteobacteria bacterium]